MRLRVRNKYLIIFTLLFLGLFSLVYASGGEYLFRIAEEARENQDYAKALAYYDAFISRFPRHSKIPEALYWSTTFLPASASFEVAIFPRHTSITRQASGIFELPEGALTLKERLLLIAEEHPEHWTANHVPFLLGKLYLRQGDRRAEEYFQAAVFGEHTSGKIEAAEELIKMYLALGQPERALEVVQFCQEELPNHMAVHMQFHKGDVLVAMGEHEQAHEAYSKVLDVHERQKQLRSTDRGNSSMDQHYAAEVAQRLHTLQSLEGSGEMVRIEGVVEITGVPLVKATVLLNSIEDRWYSSDYRRMLRAITDEQGRFSFVVPAGSYVELGLSLEESQAKMVEGYHLRMVGVEKVASPEGHEVAFQFIQPVQIGEIDPGYEYSGGPYKLRWEPYPEANSYRVGITYVQYHETGHHSVSGGLPFIVHGTELEIESIPSHPFGSIGMDSDGVYPQYLLGFRGSDAIKFQVDALDSDSRVLSSSSSLFFGEGFAPKESLVPIKKADLGEAEMLLLEREYDGAVALLEQRLMTNPSDIDTLQILARIYFSGTYNTTGDWENEQMAHQDIARSRELLERLSTLQPTVENFRALKTVLQRQGDILALYKVNEELYALGETAWDVLTGLAHQALYVEDDLKRACELLELATRDRNNYGYPMLYGLYLITGQIERAIELLNNPVEQRSQAIDALQKATVKYARSEWAKHAVKPAEFHSLVEALADPFFHLDRSTLRLRVQSFRERYDANELVEIITALAELRSL